LVTLTISRTPPTLTLAAAHLVVAVTGLGRTLATSFDLTARAAMLAPAILRALGSRPAFARFPVRAAGLWIAVRRAAALLAGVLAALPVLSTFAGITRLGAILATVGGRSVARSATASHVGARRAIGDVLAVATVGGLGVVDRFERPGIDPLELRRIKVEHICDALPKLSGLRIALLSLAEAMSDAMRPERRVRVVARPPPKIIHLPLLCP
jgi:hypothetical protein